MKNAGGESLVAFFKSVKGLFCLFILPHINFGIFATWEDSFKKNAIFSFYILVITNELV